MTLPLELHKVASGRIFARRVHATPDPFGTSPARSDLKVVQLLFGVIEVPKNAELERLHDVRVNSHLWLDTDRAALAQTCMSSSSLAETALGDVVTELKFGAGPIRDHGAVYLRATLIPHECKDMRWAFIAGAMQTQQIFQENGIYEFDDSKEGFHRVGNDTHNGDAANNVLRKPIWGPGGVWGTSTSMEPTAFQTWLIAERARTFKRDPEFAAFAELMTARCPELHVYTATQYAAREAAAREVIQEILLKRSDPAPAPAPTTARRARP